MLHVAMFDAVNSIEERYRPYHVRVRASHGASSEAAAAQAAHDVLAAVLPVNSGLRRGARSETGYHSARTKGAGRPCRKEGRRANPRMAAGRWLGNAPRRPSSCQRFRDCGSPRPPAFWRLASHNFLAPVPSPFWSTRPVPASVPADSD